MIDSNTNLTYLPDTWYYWSGGMIDDLRNGLTPVYHNFSATDFTRLYHQLAASEVYLKADSLNIFLLEHAKNDEY
ncbi:MAG: hypothetical protein IPL46_08465 [Saprospiraceae bacterium]|nr:hypothetical protein [Saprospiraceae bacterium]